jgi:hypothetical protein
LHKVFIITSAELFHGGVEASNTFNKVEQIPLQAQLDGNVIKKVANIVYNRIDV